MKTLHLILMLSFSSFVSAEDQSSVIGPPAGFFVGTYRLVGQLPDAGATYAGRVVISEMPGDKLKLTRIIAGKTVYGVARIEAIGLDKIHIIKASFPMNGKTHEAFYTWWVDPDNYARISGYINSLNAKSGIAGVEALFMEQ